MTDMTISILQEKEDGLYKGQQRILNFVPKIIGIKEIVMVDSIKLLYDVAIYRQGQKIDCITTKTLYIDNWFHLSRLCPSAALRDRDKKLIEQYLEEQVAQIPVIQGIFIDTCGWWENQEQKVFFRKDIITAKLNCDIMTVHKECRIIRTEIFKFQVSKIKKILQEIDECAIGTSWILYMASYFDILKYLFKKANFPVECVINVFAKSRTGKTSLIKAICSPSKVFSFRSGKRRDTILKEIRTYTGHTILVDDYHPTETKSDRDRQCALKDSLVRSVEEDEFMPNIIFTSEYRDGHMSLQDREIQLFLEKKVDFDLLTKLEKVTDILEEIRTAFYVQVVANADKIVSEIRTYCLDADSKSNINNTDEFRSSRYMNYICCVNHLFYKYFISNYEIGLEKYEIEDAIQKHLEIQTNHMQKIQNIEQKGTYLFTLRGMLNANILKKITDFKAYNFEINTFYMSYKNQILITPNALRNGMMKYLCRNDVPIKRIVRELRDAEALITYDKGNEFTKKVLGNRCYEIDGNVIDQFCNLFE